MRFSTAVTAAALVGSTYAAAGRPTNTSICDYYTTALLKTNNATNQLTLLTLLVNTAVIGNYTTPNMNAVPGILNPNATYNNASVNLVKYFDGSLVSTNRNNVPTSVNFLTDGGATPLEANKPANGTSSAQYLLLTHLYSYFGTALGCTMANTTTFPAYTGSASMYSVHKYMDLGAAEVGYFIQQVGLSAQSFGVAPADVTAVGTLLTSVFASKCAPAATVIPAQGPQLQSICIDSSCPNATAANCDLYYNSTSSNSSSSASGSASGSAQANASPTEPASASATASGLAASGSAGASGKSSGAQGLQVGSFAAGVLAVVALVL